MLGQRALGLGTLRAVCALDPLAQLVRNAIPSLLMQIRKVRLDVSGASPGEGGVCSHAPF